MRLCSCLLWRFGSILALFIVLIVHGDARADLMSLESYSHWVDVTNQPAAGTWTKLDGDYPVTSQGELVAAPEHGTAIPRTGATLLDLRTENQYEPDNANNGANYNYTISTGDFGGVDPAMLSSGTVELDFWICPNTWSGDTNGFVPEGVIYQETSLLNGTGDIVASVGMRSQGDSNSPEVWYRVGGDSWIDTGLIADSSTWTNVNMFVDLVGMTSRISFTDTEGDTEMSADLAWDSGITDTSVTTLNFQMIDGVTKNYFDDFAFTAIAVAVPEPSSTLAGVAAVLAFASRRRRREWA